MLETVRASSRTTCGDRVVFRCDESENGMMSYSHLLSKWTSCDSPLLQEAGINSATKSNECTEGKSKSRRPEGWKAMACDRIEENCTTCGRLLASSGFIMFLARRVTVSAAWERGMAVQRTCFGEQTHAWFYLGCLHAGRPWSNLVIVDLNSSKLIVRARL